MYISNIWNVCYLHLPSSVSQYSAGNSLATLGLKTRQRQLCASFWFLCMVVSEIWTESWGLFLYIISTMCSKYVESTYLYWIKKNLQVSYYRLNSIVFYIILSFWVWSKRDLKHPAEEKLKIFSTTILLSFLIRWFICSLCCWVSRLVQNHSVKCHKMDRFLSYVWRIVIKFSEL